LYGGGIVGYVLGLFGSCIADVVPKNPTKNKSMAKNLRVIFQF